jgi:CRP-like cAMP-binding protein
MAESVTDLLRQAEVFSRLPEPELRKVGKILKERRVPQHQVLFRQGEIADALYVIIAGRVRISITAPGGEEKVLAFLGTGDVVGEMGLLSGETRSATATASTNLIVLQLRKADFDALLASNVDLMRELARVVARRREATRQRAHQESENGQGRGEGIVSVLFAPRGGAGTTTLATNLAVALAHRAPDRVVVVDLNVLFGHVPLLLNLNPRTSLAAISPVSLGQMDRDNFEFYLTAHAASSLRVLSGVLRPEEGELVTVAHVKSALELLRRHFTYVIVDTARGFSDVNLTAIELASNILIVCTADRAGIRAVTETQRIFRELLHVPGDPLQYVLNHPSPYAALSRQQLEHTLQVQCVESIPFGGDAPTRAALEGQPLVTRFPNSAAGKAMLSLAARFEQQSREALALSSVPAMVSS